MLCGCAKPNLSRSRMEIISMSVSLDQSASVKLQESARIRAAAALGADEAATYIGSLVREYGGF